MAKNLSVHQLDPQMINQNTYDFDNDAVRVSLMSAELAIEGEEISASADITSVSAEAIPTTLCPQMKEFQVYAVAKTVLTGTLHMNLCYSPVTDGSAMVTSVNCDIGPCAQGSAVASVIANALPRSVKVNIISNTLAPGEIVTVYLIGNSF